jgi:hypothetical protein
MDPTPGAGRYRAATPDSTDLLYDRDVRTQVRILDGDRLRVTATLRDDTQGPGDFLTVHDMTLEAVISTPDMQILSVSAGMESHPHGTCPLTLAQMQQLVGLHIAGGYMGEIRRLFGGNRGCNHLHALAQTIGTVTALSFASRMVSHDPDMQLLPKPQWYRTVVDRAPGVVDSCVIWRKDGDLHRRIMDLDA